MYIYIYIERERERERGFPGGTSGKEPAWQCRRHRDVGSIPGLGRSSGGGHGNPLQYSCLENAMERGAWQAIVHRVAVSDATEASYHACMHMHKYIYIYIYTHTHVHIHTKSQLCYTFLSYFYLYQIFLFMLIHLILFMLR